MTDHQHNDNLEQFFRQNLENYSPEPPDGFWARMEPSIPVRPPFWNSWVAGAWKWLGIGLLVVAVILAGVLWWNDRQRVQELSELVQAQQREIEQLKDLQKQDNAHGTFGDNEAAGKAVVGDTSKAVGPPSWALEKVGDGGDVLTQNKKRVDKNASDKNSPGQFLNTDHQLFTKNKNTEEPPAQPVGAAAPVPSLETLQGSTPASGELQTQEMTATRLPLKIPGSLDFLPAQNLMFPELTAAVEDHEFRGFPSYPRFSVEVGASVFVAPVRHLFEKDTVVFEPGAVSASWLAGLLVNVEMNGHWMLQTGFQYKNIRSENLTLRYNSFPLNVRRRWAWGRHNRLEVKTGLALNTLVNATARPGEITLRGLQTSYLAWNGGFAVVLPLSGSLNVLAEPNLGYALTPVANGKRTVEVGMWLGLRYSIQ